METNKIDEQYNAQGDAKHYEGTRLQTIIKFERSYGTLAVMTFCEINADKYRERIGKKPGQPIEQELLKIDWYEKAAAFFFARLNTENEIIVDNRKAEPLPWKQDNIHICKEHTFVYGGSARNICKYCPTLNPNWTCYHGIAIKK